ncbi:hypothetical protein D3C81_1304880 [compost metagenome]
MILRIGRQQRDGRLAEQRAVIARLNDDRARRHAAGVGADVDARALFDEWRDFFARGWRGAQAFNAHLFCTDGMDELGTKLLGHAADRFSGSGHDRQCHQRGADTVGYETIAGDSGLRGRRHRVIAFYFHANPGFI